MVIDYWLTAWLEWGASRALRSTLRCVCEGIPGEVWLKGHLLWPWAAPFPPQATGERQKPPECRVLIVCLAPQTTPLLQPQWTRLFWTVSNPSFLKLPPVTAVRKVGNTCLKFNQIKLCSMFVLCKAIWLYNFCFSWKWIPQPSFLLGFIIIRVNGLWSSVIRG